MSGGGLSHYGDRRVSVSFRVYNFATDPLTGRSAEWERSLFHCCFVVVDFARRSFELRGTATRVETLEIPSLPSPDVHAVERRSKKREGKGKTRIHQAKGARVEDWKGHAGIVWEFRSRCRTAVRTREQRWRETRYRVENSLPWNKPTRHRRYTYLF